jgi:hypothetical protein
MQYYLTGGYRFDVRERWSVQPAALLEFSGKTAPGYELMLTGIYNRFLEAGVGVATHSCLKVAAGISITPSISLRYQLSQNLGNTYNSFGSSHFVSLWLKF